MGGVHTAQKAGTVHSGFEGFGVAITGSSCWNLMQMEKAERHAFLESIYGKNGLGLTTARLSIAASDYSAEVYSYDDIMELKTEQQIKLAGKLRIEGKDYVVQDGDVMHFRFNV